MNCKRNIGWAENLCFFVVTPIIYDDLYNFIKAMATLLLIAAIISGIVGALFMVETFCMSLVIGLAGAALLLGLAHVTGSYYQMAEGTTPIKQRTNAVLDEMTRFLPRFFPPDNLNSNHPTKSLEIEQEKSEPKNK